MDTLSTMAETTKTSEALRKATGRDYDEWYAVLDRWGAPGRPFREISDFLTENHGFSKWWAQKLIVEYEQLRGIRPAGVRPSGTFTAGASKTVAAPATRVLEAFVDAGVRRRWLSGVQLRKRTVRPGRSARFDSDGGTRVNVTVIAQGKGKSQVAVEQELLPDAKAAEKARGLWRERLTALKELLEG